MLEAVELSRHGYPAPNPHVGAVVVRGGEIVGRGFHNSCGMPHAETAALHASSGNAVGADLYVTLEPCSHVGRTPPCTEAIIEAGIARVFFACKDPNPKAGGGAGLLRRAGIEVIEGLCEREAAAVNFRFLERYRLGRPHVTVKAAIGLDGRIATSSGDSKWITDETARARAHELRAQCGCVIVGANTVAKDDPELTVRAFAVTTQPRRVVIDGRGTLQGTEKVFCDGKAQTSWLVGAERAIPNTGTTDVVVLGTTPEGRFDIADVLEYLQTEHETSVLVEGGGQTIGGFMKAGLVDEVELHVAPKVIGAGPNWADFDGAEKVSEALQLSEMLCEPLGNGLKLFGRIHH